jgi:alpha-tubulin suppressor-like RCC1 family protein
VMVLPWIVDRNVPTAVDLGFGRTAKMISAGYTHTCAILDDDSVKCWGDNMAGEIGDGTTESRTVATTAAIGIGRTALSISVSYSHSCAVLDDFSIKCWGYNYNGQIGDGTSGFGNDRSTPTLVQNLGVGRIARSVAAGRSHTCAILDDRSVKCWGAVPPSLEKSLTPNTLTVGVGRYAEKISVGQGHSCAVLDDGSMKCVGSNYQGQLGDRTTTDRAIATTVLISAERSALDVSVGWASTCAVLDDMSLVCWGEFLGLQALWSKSTTPLNIDLGSGRTVLSLMPPLSPSTEATNITSNSSATTPTSDASRSLRSYVSLAVVCVTFMLAY